MSLSLDEMRRKVKVFVTQLYPTLCDPMDCSPPGSSIHGILQTSMLEWVAIPFFKGSLWPRIGTRVFHITGRFFYPLSHQRSLKMSWGSFYLMVRTEGPQIRFEVHYLQVRIHLWIPHGDMGCPVPASYLRRKMSWVGALLRTRQEKPMSSLPTRRIIIWNRLCYLEF